MALDLHRFFVDVFEPEPDEVVTVACDVPTPAAPDRPAWRERRAMAEEWRRAFEGLGARVGFTTNPLLTYAATGANNADLPERATLGTAQVRLDEALAGTTLALFLTQFSATAPLDRVCRGRRDFRAASMPGVEKRMERTALAADYREVARRCHVVADLMRDANALDVTFSTGHACRFDLRFRTPEVDDGSLPRHKPGDRVINLPSGETFVVPYEGEREGVPSGTAGEIPVRAGDELVVFAVAANRIVRIEGGGEAAARYRELFAADPARANVAEVAFGCNEWAEVTGNVLEDEKAGFHWAYGRSDHLGGTVAPSAFAGPHTVVHQDIVYARGNPIQIAEAVLTRPEGRVVVLRDGNYVVF
jgi:leucyl aminopeptidase (aminopeptidase T)